MILEGRRDGEEAGIIFVECNRAGCNADVEMTRGGDCELKENVCSAVHLLVQIVGRSFID